MRSSRLFCLCVVAVAGCSTPSVSSLPGNGPVAPSSGLKNTAHAAFRLRAGSPAYSILYAFQGLGGIDGVNPQAGVTGANGLLYGTTFSGTTLKMPGCTEGCGTVYAVNPAGQETFLYSFAGAPGDGAGPQASVINVNGTLLGHDRLRREQRRKRRGVGRRHRFCHQRVRRRGDRAQFHRRTERRRGSVRRTRLRRQRQSVRHDERRRRPQRRHRLRDRHGGEREGLYTASAQFRATEPFPTADSSSIRKAICTARRPKAGRIMAEASSR